MACKNLCITKNTKILMLVLHWTKDWPVQMTNMHCSMEKDAYGVSTSITVFSVVINIKILDLHIHCPGQPGHGSLLLDNTAGEKVAYIVNKFYEFREKEKKKLKDNPNFTIGDVTTVNLTLISVSSFFFLFINF